MGRDGARDVLLSLAQTGVPIHPNTARRLWDQAEVDPPFELRLKEAREQRERANEHHAERLRETREQLEAVMREAREKGIDLDP